MEYIELKSEKPNYPLQGYKIIGISTGTPKSKQGTIELVVNLWDEVTDENGLFVIGGAAVENAQLKVPNRNIMYHQSFRNQPQQLLISNFLLNGWSQAKAESQSAEAERGFSIMNHIKYDRRSRLTGGNLENLLRIRINGPDDLDSFSAIKYAKRWVSEKHYRTDDPNRVIKGSLLKADYEYVEVGENQLISRSNLF